MASTLAVKPIGDGLRTSSTNWQMEVLMEKLRSKACSLRPIPETSKLIKQSILNKQHILEPVEKAALGQCLDLLQQNIKVTSLPAMVERLESTARQLGLTFTSGSSGPEVYISCDMFYVEVHLQNEGKVRDVTVELAGNQNEPRSQSSPELVECLNKGNFSDFMGHLEGFLSIYQLNTDKKTKCKVYQALQALEIDLLKLFEMAQETLGGDTQRLLLKSPVGLLIKRKGGHPVKMIYFNSPYELLDVEMQRSISLTYETAASRELEYHVSVTIEPSTSHKLQAASLVNIKKGSDGLKLPCISGLSSTNSVLLPACFTLRLKTPMAISVALAQKISDVTGVSCFDAAEKQPLLPLIIKQATSEFHMDTNNNKGLFVTLPDQQHCYFLASNEDFEGILLHRVPFTHPASVAHILEFLRIQAVFNSLITSCVRPESKQAMESAFIFEVTAVSHDYISVTFEHPQEESTATAELDLTDLINVKCKLYTLTQDPILCSDEYATKVLQRCLSIPITMRAVMRKIVKENKKETLPQGDSVVKMESNNLAADPNQNTKFLFNEYGSLGMRRDQVVGPHSNNINNGMAKDSACNQTLFGGNSQSDSIPTLISSIGGPSISSSTTLVGSFGSTLLSSVSQQKNQVQHHFLADSKTAKVRKRKSVMDSDHKGLKTCDDIVIEVNDKSSDSLISEASLHMRRDVKFEKLQNILGKRRSSADNTGLSDTGSCELAALREKVYGAGSAASFAKLSYMHTGPKDAKDFTRKFKKQKSEGVDFKKSPIVLDLTDAESARKVVCSTTTASSVSLSAALLKRPGIEIIPIPGSNTPISIPSSITVTPVIKSSDDKFKDKKDKKDRSKDIDKRDKKRRREDSPNRSSGSSLITKTSKIQIINTGTKHPSLSASLDSLKNDGKTISGVTMKPSSTSYHSPIKKPTISPNISKSLVTQNKLSYSPSHKPNKLLYNPAHLSVSSSITTSTSPSLLTSSSSNSSVSSSKSTTSPKSSSSPKHSSASPKHSSIGKPSMNTLKSNSPTFTKPSLSPKLNKSMKEKEKGSSPSRPLSSPVPFSSSSTSPLSMKSKFSSTPTDKPKPVFSEALTITKVSSGETISSSSISLTSCSLSSAFSQTGSQNMSAASLLEKLSVEKAKASPPKNRKGSSLSDIVDKLRAGVSGSGSGDPQCKDKSPKIGADGKKEGDNFTIKSSTGLKFTINKAKHKEGSGGSKSNPTGYNSPNSTSPSSKNSNKSPSGLKPGVMSAPASKKVSMSSLPPIPKLPPASISSITATAISPLGNSLSMAHSSPLQYGRERQRDTKERDRDKERSGGDKVKQKNMSNFKGDINSIEVKKELQEKNFLGKSATSQKEDKNRPYLSGTSPKKKPQITDSVDRALKDIFGEDENMGQGNIENFETQSSSEFIKQTLPRKTSIGERLEQKSKSELNVLTSVKETENIKDSSELMAPPQIPLPLGTKLVEKDASQCMPPVEPLQKENVPTMPPLPMARSNSPMSFPPSSPSVSIKIVKSPAPVTSPLNMISPQSVTSQHSPCIIDDELMDEALMGSRK